MEPFADVGQAGAFDKGHGVEQLLIIHAGSK
jgi:hypothetical protein